VSRRVKLVCTLGPKSSTPRLVRALAEMGGEVFRINFSHGTPMDHAKYVEVVRKVETEIDRELAVLADLPGPKIRLGGLDEFPGARGPENALRTGAPPVPGEPSTEQGCAEAKPGKHVPVGTRRSAGGADGHDEITTEPDPGEEQEEYSYQQHGAAAVAPLLGEEIPVGHIVGLRDRSTCGTARSCSSTISHSSTGSALARPASRFQGNWACRTLYEVAVSL